MTLPHGLGTEPLLIQCILVCKVAPEGYSVGDKVFIASSGWLYAAGTPYSVGLSVVADATNINIRFASFGYVFHINNKTTGTIGNLANDNWRLIIRALAM